MAGVKTPTHHTKARLRMPTPPNPSTQPAVTIPPARRQRTPAARPHDPLPDDANVPAADTAYVAFLFARSARTAQQAIRAAVAAGVQVPGWAGSAAWLYDYHAWTLTRTATPDAGTAGQARTAQAPHGGGR